MLNLRPAEVTTTWPSLGPPPRSARLRRSTWLIGAGVPAVFLVLALVIWRDEQRDLAELQEIIDTGTEASGQVVGLRVSRSGRQTEYLVACRYLAGGRSYTRQFESKTVYDRAPSDRSVVVSYAAADPLRARLGTREALARERERGLSTRWLPPGLLAAFGVIFASFFWNSINVLLRLARDGVVRWGTVTDVRAVKQKSIVTVLVDDALGSTVATGTVGGDAERFQPIGSQAAVLSDPNEPSRVRLAEEVSARIEIAPAAG